MAGLCQDCYDCCCSCFRSLSSKRRSSKYDYVKYTSSKPSKISPSPRHAAKKTPQAVEVESRVLRPEQVFEFPQEKTEHHSSHPQMFVEREPVVAQQPRPAEYGRFHSYAGSTLSPTMQDYTRGVAAGQSSTLPRRKSADITAYDKSSSLPRHFKRGYHSLSSVGDSESDDLEGRASAVGGDGGSGLDLTGGSEPISSSLPDLALSHLDGKDFSSSSLLLRGRRATFPAVRDTESWIPNLPVLEETSIAESSSEPHPPILQFSLHYDVQRFTLTVHLHHGSNLPAKDRRGTSDPFVVLYMIPNKEEIFESKVIYQTLNPIFDQSFEFKKLTTDDIRRQTLVLRVYDHDKFSRNDTIGAVLLPLEEADLFGVVMRMKIDDDPNLFSGVSHPYVQYVSPQREF